MDPVIAWGAAAVSIVVGVLVLRARQPRIGGLLVAHGVSFGVILSLTGVSTSRAGLVVDQLAAGSWVFLFLWLVLIAYLVPDGHALSPRWRGWIRWGLLGVVAFLVGATDDAVSFRQAHQGADPPLRLVPGPVADALGAVGFLVTVMFVFGGGIAVRARLRRAEEEQRLQLLWLVWGALSLPAALVLAWIGHFAFDDNDAVVDPALVLAGVGLPVSIGVAVLRHRLFDVRVVLSRTLTYGALTAAVVALYAVLLLGARRFLGDGSVGGLLAVGIVAVAVHPAYSVLRTRIERWVYGYRSDPAAALRRLGASIESTSVEPSDPLRVAETISASVADALKVDVVHVSPPGEPAAGERIALVHRGDHVADLIVEVPPGRTLSTADASLLRDLAQHAAVTVRAAQLAAELQASRLRIVTAREEERRRLRRDLHDGIGPALAAIGLKLQAAQSRRDERQRNDLLDEIREETRTAITEIRRVVDDLRPPAIDEVGLLDAIGQRAASLSTDALTFHVGGPDGLPPLPAAVEVAAFRIASEAMTNVAKHSGASRCTVDLDLDEALAVRICDNGQGPVVPRSLGVGWTSMTERAAELGGTCTIAARAEGGLVVHAMLPLEQVSS